MIILHFALKNEWESEIKNGFYGESLISRDNFISCFNFADVSSINFNFSTLKEFVILCIDENKVNSKIKYEKEDNIDKINIYGKINKESIVSVLPYTFDENDKFVITKELLDFNIINEVCNNLNIKYESHKYFNDGTKSRIILLNNLYIIKQAAVEELKADVTFATFYKNVLMLQKMVYFDKDYRYVVHEFVPGDVMYTVENFFDLSNNLKTIVSHYKHYNHDGFGYLESPVNSWDEFLRNEVNSSSKHLPEIDYLLPVVNSAIDELSRMPFEKKLIHGDFGTHNFIKQNEKFIAAIDPIPVLGDPTYDLLFALVSNIDLIPYLSIDFLTEYTGESRAKITALLKVCLYVRICRCAKYNKDWVEPYLEFGNNLFN